MRQTQRPDREGGESPSTRCIFFRRFKVVEEGPPLRLVTTFHSRDRARYFAQMHARRNHVATTMFDGDPPPNHPRGRPIEERFDSNGVYWRPLPSGPWAVEPDVGRVGAAGRSAANGRSSLD